MFSGNFRREGLAVVSAAVFLSSAIIWAGGAEVANAATKITTCTNIKSSAIRVLAKGTCNAKTERMQSWVSSNSAEPGSATPIPKAETFTYKVGDVGPGGGVIFFVDTSNQYPSFMYLEAAPVDLKDTYIWCSDSSHAITGLSEPTGVPIGRGSANTSAMLTACSSGAANAAHEYSGSGKSDWFLPSREELMAMYTNIHASSTFVPTDYWSSSQNSDVFAMTVNFGSGNWFSIDKSFSRHVRPIRAFSTTTCQ